MDKLRAMASGVAEGVARTRFAAVLGALPAHVPRHGDGAAGQGLAEYALILGLIAVVAIASLVFLGGTIAEMFFDPIDERFGEILCNVIGICP